MRAPRTARSVTAAAAAGLDELDPAVAQLQRAVLEVGAHRLADEQRIAQAIGNGHHCHLLG